MNDYDERIVQVKESLTQEPNMYELTIMITGEMVQWLERPHCSR